MYPGLSSLLQQLAADPSDELLASRIVSLLQDIPDGEYKVDQLLAAAQMLLGVSPRLGLICAHAAFRCAPARLESLAIAEEALDKMGRRAKVQVLRQERKRLEAEVFPTIELTATVSEFLLKEESTPIFSGGVSHDPDGGVDATIVVEKKGATVPPHASELSIVSVDLMTNYEMWKRLGSCDEASFAVAFERATIIAKLSDEALYEAVEKIPGAAGIALISARMTAFLVVDAVLLMAPPIIGQTHEIATGIMARLLAWHDGDASEVATAIRDSVSLRLKSLPGALQEGLSRVLREQTRSGRPSPTFSTTTL